MQTTLRMQCFFVFFFFAGLNSLACGIGAGMRLRKVTPNADRDDGPPVVPKQKADGTRCVCLRVEKSHCYSFEFVSSVCRHGRRGWRRRAQEEGRRAAAHGHDVCARYETQDASQGHDGQGGRRRVRIRSSCSWCCILRSVFRLCFFPPLIQQAGGARQVGQAGKHTARANRSIGAGRARQTHHDGQCQDGQCRCLFGAQDRHHEQEGRRRR